VAACEKDGDTASQANGIPEEAVPGHRAIVACREHMSCSAGTIVRRGELDDAWPHQPRL